LFILRGCYLGQKKKKKKKKEAAAKNGKGAQKVGENVGDIRWADTGALRRKCRQDRKTSNNEKKGSYRRARYNSSTEDD